MIEIGTASRGFKLSNHSRSLTQAPKFEFPVEETLDGSRARTLPEPSAGLVI